MEPTATKRKVKVLYIGRGKTETDIIYISTHKLKFTKTQDIRIPQCGFDKWTAIGVKSQQIINKKDKQCKIPIPKAGKCIEFDVDDAELIIQKIKDHIMSPDFDEVF